MRLNQSGDALTIAMLASVFVAASVMVMVAVLSNLDAKGRRLRMQNEIDGITLSMKQLMSNRDMCTTALRDAAGAVLAYPEIPRPGPPWPVIPPKPIQQVFMGPTKSYCDMDTAGCVSDGFLDIRDITWQFNNNSSNNRYIAYLGDRSVPPRFSLISGEIVVDFLPQAQIFGGHLQARQFSLHLIIDNTDGGKLMLCYYSESPAQICAQMGGSLDATGACTNLFGRCDSLPYMLQQPCSPIPPGSSIDACDTALGLVWVRANIATGINPSFQMNCECQWVCSAP